MRKQYAVFGLGNFGKHLALGLENLGCEVIVVDNSMEKIQEIADKVSYAMCANIEDPEVIKSLGARNLDGAVIAISENFGTSIMATIMAKEIGSSNRYAPRKHLLPGRPACGRVTPPHAYENLVSRQSTPVLRCPVQSP